MTNKLLYIVNKTDLQLLTLSDIITWKDREQLFIVNLIFSTANLKQWVINYYMNSSLKNDSNHHSIFTQFSLNRQSQMMKCHHNWKKMNAENIAAEIQYLQSFRNLYSTANIENYTNYLLEFINQLIKNIISWFKSASEYNYMNSQSLEYSISSLSCLLLISFYWQNSHSKSD